MLVGDLLLGLFKDPVYSLVDLLSLVERIGWLGEVPLGGRPGEGDCRRTGLKDRPEDRSLQLRRLLDKRATLEETCLVPFVVSVAFLGLSWWLLLRELP